MGRQFWGWLWLAPSIVVVGLLVLGLAHMAEQSFHKLDLATYRLQEAHSLDNYATILERAVYLRVLWRTFLGAVIVTILTLILAFPYAYVMVRTPSPWIRKTLLIALFLPFFIGQVVRAYGWLILLGQEGLVNTTLAGLGLPTIDLIYNFPAVVFGLVQYMLPFAVLMLAPAITAIPEDVERASEGLGASWVATFRHVVLPMARPGLVGASVVVFTLTLTDFATPEIMGGGTTDFIASAVYDAFFQISDAGLGSALAVVLVAVGNLLVAILFVLFGTGTLAIRRGDSA